jgi:HAD superfamily hydrolase (TIGR01549 family)
MRAILFDLDDTLIDSRTLREARGRKAWDEVYARLAELQPFPTAPHEVPGRLRRIGFKVGVVTASPRPYANQILAMFGIDVDVLVTGSDGHPAKPDPSSINAAVGDLGDDRAEVAYVGDLSSDHKAAALAGVTSVGALWAYPGGGSPAEWLKQWPDLALSSPELLEAPEEWGRLAPMSEAALAGHEPIRHRGSVLQHPEGFSLGRYFTTTDQRADRPLSRAILSNKHAHTDAQAFTLALDGFLRAPELQHQLRGAIVTNVPPAPGDTFDRFAPHRASVVAAVGGRQFPDLLRQGSDVVEYKHLFGRVNRDQVNVDRFEATARLSGEPIVLLDDVVTTGSQLASCREALVGAGAGDILCIAMAHSQDPLPRYCARCGVGIMRLMNGRRGEFWGCSRYWTTGCPYTEDA